MTTDGNGALRFHGGFRELRSFHCAQLIYDGTVLFCKRFLDKDWRTRDQMVQAARSGTQNIAEGSMAAGTSAKTEMKLTSVARASLVELLLDYEDFLRQRALPLWPKESPEALRAREALRNLNEAPGGTRPPKHRQPPPVAQGPDPKEQRLPEPLASQNPEVAANTMICLIHQATYLLRRQLAAQERAFLAQGGFSENLHRQRVAARSQG